MWSLHSSQGWSVQTILRLHFDEGIPFSSICANQRLVNEDWLALLGIYEIFWHIAYSDTPCWGCFPSLEWSGHWQWHFVVHSRYIVHIIPRYKMYVSWNWRQSILINLTNAGSPWHGTSHTHYWRNWKGGVFPNPSTYHKYYRSTNTLVDYFR